jgi:hypothetical protein
VLFAYINSPSNAKLGAKLERESLACQLELRLESYFLLKINIQNQKAWLTRERRLPAYVLPQPVGSLTPKGSTSSKNIMKNYCRALTTFALSTLAQPYLESILEASEINREDFQEFIHNKKEKVNCIKNLRELLLPTEDDPKQIQKMKNIFKQISIIFMKYFSVNWIYHGKVQDRLSHLRYKFKILRKIQNPIHFTCLEDFAK